MSGEAEGRSVFQRAALSAFSNKRNHKPTIESNLIIKVKLPSVLYLFLNIISSVCEMEACSSYYDTKILFSVSFFWSHCSLSEGFTPEVEIKLVCFCVCVCFVHLCLCGIWAPENVSQWTSEDHDLEEAGGRNTDWKKENHKGAANVTKDKNHKRRREREAKWGQGGATQREIEDRRQECLLYKADIQTFSNKNYCIALL